MLILLIYLNYLNNNIPLIFYSVLLISTWKATDWKGIIFTNDLQNNTKLYISVSFSLPELSKEYSVFTVGSSYFCCAYLLMGGE